MKKNIGRFISNKINMFLWEKHKISDWYHTYISKKIYEYQTVFGYRLRTRGYIANKLMVNSVFEMAEMNILKSLIEKSDVFVDVGANIGYYTCMACSLGKQVVAFEPQQHNLSCLLDNVFINKWKNLVEIYPIGLGEKADILNLYGASGPSASLLSGWAGYSNKFKKQIPINSLDNILSDRFNDKKLIIKIDVEGAEYNVLKGAIITLKRACKPTWFLEICLKEFHPNGINQNFEETFKLFFENGYEAHVADDTRRVVNAEEVRAWFESGTTDSPVFNYYFVPVG